MCEQLISHRRTSLSRLTKYDLHRRLIHNYVLCRKRTAKERDSSRDRRDIDVIKEQHRFLWDEEDTPDSWEARLAKKYYDKLFKEYCICDLTFYKENKVAMRWRTEQELVIGKGQFMCGEKNCSVETDLRSWEVNFSYCERGKRKNALVKLRLCPVCSEKLNYRHKKKEVKVKEKEHNAKRFKPNTDEKDVICDKESPEEKYNIDGEKLISREATESVEAEIWKNPDPNTLEKSRDEEFQNYLEDLLL